MAGEQARPVRHRIACPPLVGRPLREVPGHALDSAEQLRLGEEVAGPVEFAPQGDGGAMITSLLTIRSSKPTLPPALPPSPAAMPPAAMPSASVPASSAA